MNSYARFAAMIATSTLVMFGLMYLNTYQLNHVFFSDTRAYMALVMGATMAVIMLAMRFIPTVNSRYPDAAPRSTVPPSILAVLPSLPAALEYRFVGSDLLLLDRNT